MKKLLFLLVLINAFIFSQRKPGIDYMPQIGFFDFVVNYLSNPNDHLATQPAIYSRYSADNWYFDSLKSLGLTNLVTDAQFHQNLDHILDSFYLNDMGFAWKHDLSLNPPRYFLPARSMNSLGHREENYVIELGSDFNVSTISLDDNFGFGVTKTQQNTTSYWVLKPGVGQLLGIDSTGMNGEDTQVQPHVYSRMALTQYHTAGEAIMWAQLPWTQFPLKDSLKIRILFRRGQAPSNWANLFTINATSIKGTPLAPGYIVEGRRDHRILDVEPETVPTLFIQEVTANDLTNDHLTNYAWFESNPILIDKDQNFEFNIIWSGNADLFIDKIMVYNTAYEELYVDFTVPAQNSKSQLLATYPPAEVDSFFQSFYFDEPFQLSAQYRGEIQKYIDDNYHSANQNFEVNSAVGGIPKHFLDFDKKYARPEETSPVFKKYLLYNMYPIDKNTITSTTSVQKMLDLFCNYNNVDDTPGSPYDPDRYKYVGLLNAQLAAKEAGIPFIMTLGVHSEQYLLNTGRGRMSIVQKDHTRRAPTKDEIFAMGNLALAYGAKGFMYYMIPTRAGTPLDSGKVVWNTYGLFDEEGNPFNLENGTGLIQNPSEKQIPNERFYYVKDFIKSTNLIEKTLLKLEWQSTRNWAKYPSTDEWITNLSSRYPPFGEDDDANKTFVETGFFLEKSPPPGKIDTTRYVYLVNRRCNIQPENSPDNYEDNPDTSYRSIRFSLNFPNSKWNNYTVTDLKTDSVYCTTKTGVVSIFLGAGDNSEEVMMIFNNLVEEKYKSSGIIDTVGKVTPLLTYLNSNFPTSEYTKSANLLFSDVSNSSSPVNSPLNKPQVSGTETEGIGYDYNLYNNYPNPFNPETVVKFSLKEKSNVTLTVYNIAGQKVAELVTGEMEKGMYEKRFNGTKLSSGVYIFCLNAQSLEHTSISYTKTMKSLLLK